MTANKPGHALQGFSRWMPFLPQQPYFRARLPAKFKFDLSLAVGYARQHIFICCRAYPTAKLQS